MSNVHPPRRPVSSHLVRPARRPTTRSRWLSWRRFCPTSAEIGLKNMDGAFADYCLVDAKYAVVIPDEISWAQAAPLSCAGVTVWHAIKKVGLKPGQILGISGVGALGLLGVQLARATVGRPRRRSRKEQWLTRGCRA